MAVRRLVERNRHLRGWYRSGKPKTVKEGGIEEL
jgi:hypothetical protein